jgi:hypothetical protein
MASKVTITETDAEKTWVYEGHWAGRDDLKNYVGIAKEFKNQLNKLDRSILRHIPTGLELASTRHEDLTTPDDARAGYITYDFGTSLWEPQSYVALRVAKSSNYDTANVYKFEKETCVETYKAFAHFRNVYGNIYTVESVVPFPSHFKMPWSTDVIDILMNLILISKDRESFRNGGPPLPDRVIFKPANLREYAFELINHVPKV